MSLSSVLRLFVDVRKREVEPALLFFFFWFLVIMVFQVLKALKKGLFLESLGAHTELYAKLANLGFAVLAVVVFTALYNRLGSRKLVASLCAVFAAVLLFFGFLLRSGQPGALTNWSFYIFGDAWSTVWVTTFWAYLNELTVSDQSKRLYGLIGGGAVIAGLVANVLVWQLVEAQGASRLLVGCALVTVVIGIVLWRTEVLASQPGSTIGRRNTDRLRVSSERKNMNAAVEGARVVAASRYLLAIVAMVFLYELTSQILDYQYSTAAEGVKGTGATQAFLAQVGTIIGVLSVLSQFLLFPFFVKRLGMTAALLVLPAAMAVSTTVYLALPVLWTAALLSISDNSFSYSINQTSRETLYVPTSPDVKYKARAFANMFVQRAGKAVAIVIALALPFVPVRFLSLVAFPVVAAWIVLAVYAGRRFDALTEEAPAGAPAEEVAAKATV